MSGAFTSSKAKQKSKSEQDPWSPTIPYLEDYLGQIGGLATEPLSGSQLSAVGDLKQIYGEGNPYATQLDTLANDFFTGPGSQSGMLGDAYATLQSQLTPYAEGKFLDFKENPYVNEMMTNVGDNVQQRINAMFAGAGRDMSGMNMKSVGRGVAEAQTPILAELYNREQDRALGAANTLFGAGNATATGMQSMDTANLDARTRGIPVADAAMGAEMWGPQGIFNLEQTVADSPFARLGALGSLLLPVAQLGQQQSGSGTTKQSGFNVGANLLSDERMKEDLQQIGTLADGTPIYRFRYKGEDTTRIGLSAQELEDISPEAVTEYEAPQAGTEDGRVKYVNMDAATRRSAEMMKSGMGPVSPPGGADGSAMPPPMARPMLEDELEPYMRSAA